MLLTDVFPTVRSLPRADKLRLMQFLVVELAQEEGVVPCSLPALNTQYGRHSATCSARYKF